MASIPTQENAPERARLRFGAPLLLRIALLVAAPILFFCTLEAALRLVGFGKPTEFFIPDEKPGYFRTNPNFTAPFIPASFGIQPLNFRIRRHKEPKSVRVFVLGESAAQGIPDPDFGFAAQLGAQLRARYPGTSFEVYNLGITAIDSHVIYRIVRQVADFEPDLLVIYMGNNEVVGPYGPGCAYMSASPPVGIIRASAWVRGTRTGQLLATIIGVVHPSGARATEWKGMETFSENSVRGGDPRLDDVYRNFATNLQDIVSFASRSGIRTVLSTEVANLKDSAPFISLHRSGLSGTEAKNCEAASDAGAIAWDLGDTASATHGYEEASRIDPEFAQTRFRLGQLAEAHGDRALAMRQYQDALHWDALRFRPDTRINEIIRRVAQGAVGSTFFLDAAREMGSEPGLERPLAGREILFDHVHFNWSGNFQMARHLADACAAALNLGAPTGPDLDAAGCAASLGYTPEAGLKMLQVVVQLMLRPPFTNQLTFSENQARLKREIELAEAQIGAPGARAAHIEALERALQLDPDDASLALRLGNMESDSGDLGRALSLQEKAGVLQPKSAELSMRMGETLIRLKRFEEAEALLLGSMNLDEEYFSPSRTLVELWTVTRQFDKGRAFFERELAKRPSNHYLRLEYAKLLGLGGDQAGAEREARRIWDADPGSRPAMAALELLIHLYELQGRTGVAEALSVEAGPRQALDYYNNQRLVRIYSEKGDAARTAESLRAVAASGPFSSAEHIDLAHRLADLNLGREMLDQLAEARAVAEAEENEAQIKAVNGLIESYRRRFGAEQER